jgi:transketolase
MSYEQCLGDLAESDERIVVMTAENRAAIRGLPARLGPRFIDTGITEMTMVGMAAGLALRGRIPVVHALAAFLTLRAYEFIRTDIGITGASVKLVGYVPGILSEANGPTHQAIEDLALMRAIPGLRVFCPADGQELVAGLPHVVADPHPWYIRYVDASARLPHTGEFASGRAEIHGDNCGTPPDVALVACGYVAGEALGAAEILGREGLRVRVVNLRTLVPVDEAALLDAARAGLVVTIEDHRRIGGLHSLLCELLVERGLRANIRAVALDGWFTPALLADAIVRAGLDAGSIAARTREWLSHLEVDHVR